jgi:hypothetical protein
VAQRLSPFAAITARMRCSVLASGPASSSWKRWASRGAGGLVAAGAAHLPAVWLGVGLVVALVGLAPRTAPLAWLLLAHAVFVGVLGEVVRLPAGARALSPFDHVPALPAAELAWGPGHRGRRAARGGGPRRLPATRRAPAVTAAGTGVVPRQPRQPSSAGR